MGPLAMIFLPGSGRFQVEFGNHGLRSSFSMFSSWLLGSLACAFASVHTTHTDLTCPFPAAPGWKET